MQELPLNPGDYEGTYKCIGGRPSLDFINTVSWPDTDRSHDWLDRAENVITWAQALEIIDTATARTLARDSDLDPRATAASLRRLHQQRQTVREVLGPLGLQETPDKKSVEAFNALLDAIASYRRIDPISLRWAWERPQCLEDIARPVIFDAANVLTGTDVDLTRIGQCPACSWLFYDHTRSRNRRWCDMADCGSRDKALRYYHRKRQK